MITVRDTKFPQAKLYLPEVFEDDRGFFKETYSREKYAALGMAEEWVQDSTSYSSKNVIRGMHYDHRMAKFVQCLRGRIFDVIVDARKDSPSYKQWQGFHLSEHNHLQIYIPRGFAHGFLALSDDVVVHYKQSAHFDPTQEHAISWEDPQVGIDWPLVGEPRVSAKDQAVPMMA